MYFISFDVATKSLAVSIIKYAEDNFIYPHIEEIYTKYKDNTKDFEHYVKLLKNTNDILNNRYKIEYLDVVDLIPNKKLKETTTVERTIYLKKYLENTLKEKILNIPKNKRQFLIEYQMGPNDKSRTISAQLMLYCSLFSNDDINIAKNQIILVGPSLKNTLHFSTDEKSKHSYYLSKYTTNYAANKNHTKYLLKKIVQLYNQSNILDGISKTHLDDAADAVCMTFAYIQNYY